MARLSMSAALVRYCSTGPKTRRVLHAINIFFMMMFTVSLVRLMVLCSRPSAWRVSTQITQCKPVNDWKSGILVITSEFFRTIPHQVTHVKKITADLICEILLVGAPLYMLRSVKLPRQQRRLILSCFAAGAFSAIPPIANLIVVEISGGPTTASWVCTISIVVSVKVCLHNHHPRFTKLHLILQAAVTLMVCNLLVTITFIYSMFWKEDGDSVITESEETKDKPSKSDGQYTNLGVVPVTTERSALTLTEISGTPYSSANTPSDPESTMESSEGFTTSNNDETSRSS
jgi:hypothetical protein